MSVIIDPDAGITTPALVNTGTTTVPAGSASAPTITTDGDTNTGLFFPAADTVGLVTGGLERIRADSAGRVTMPYQPAFFAGRTLGNTSINTPIVFNSVTINIGSGYNSSTGRFTAPVSGAYFLSSILLGNSSSTVESQIYLNGNPAISGRTQNSASNSEASNVHGVVYMNANDFADVRILSGAIYGNEVRTDNFSGFLIG